MNKKDSTELTTDVLIADALLRLKVIENLLIAKGVFTRDEFLQEMEVVAQQVAKSVLQKAGLNDKVDELLRTFQPGKKFSGN